MSKNITQQEIAAPENASEVADANEIADTEQQETKNVRKNGRRVFFTSKKIAQLAVFAALAIVMKLIGKSLTLTSSFTITFVYLPWLISGAALGPIGGMIVGFISDVVGNFIFGATFLPLTILANTLYPLFIGLIYKLPVKNDYVKCVAGGMCSLLVCTLGIGSLSLYLAYYSETMGFFEYLLFYRMSQVGVFAVNLGLLLALVRPLQHVGLFPKSEVKEKSERIFVFALAGATATALMIAAYIILIINAPTLMPGDDVRFAVVCVMIAELYVALVMLSAFIFASKSRRVVSLAILSGFAAAVCAFALTATISSPTIITALKYVISILSCLATGAVIAIAAFRSFGKTRSKNL